MSKDGSCPASGGKGLIKVVALEIGMQALLCDLTPTETARVSDRRDRLISALADPDRLPPHTDTTSTDGIGAMDFITSERIFS